MLVACISLGGPFVSSSRAVTDAELLTQFGSEGSAAGQLKLPNAIAADPVTGHVLVAGGETHNRIDEFTPWGGFVKAFGWDVAPGAVDEEQEVRVRATAGQFRLGFGASTTTDLGYGAPAGESEGPDSVEAALNALPTIASGGGSVSVSIAHGNAAGTTPYVYVVRFEGSLAGTDVEEIVASDGTTALSGGDPSTELEVRTRADGTPGGTGLESCTAASGCKAGTEGTEAGQLEGASSIALDSSGDIYIRESKFAVADVEIVNQRLQKFDSAGRFLWMVGREVNKTTGANICAKADLESGDECGTGLEGTGPNEFTKQAGRNLAIGPLGSVFVPDKERIQEFEPDGSFKTEIPVPGETVRQLALDLDSGTLYVTFNSGQLIPVKEDVHKLNSSGASLGTLKVTQPLSLATDATGNVYVVDERRSGYKERVLEFGSNGELLGSLAEPELVPGQTNERRFELRALGTNTVGNLYVANSWVDTDTYIRLYGPPPLHFEGPPLAPPTIVSQYAASVESTEAVLRAEINPHFWTDARYYVEYGTGKCSEGLCDQKSPLPPGAQLTSKAIDASVKSGGVLLDDLEPATTYHYRFVAESSGGGPVRGFGGAVGTDGGEATFRTFPSANPTSMSCANQAFRTGLSATLPDCRAHEMVSPVQKSNGDILAPINITGFSTGYYQSSADGEKLTYSSYRAFGDSEAAPYINQYIASRGTGGWTSESLEGPRGAPFYAPGFTLDNQFKAFSPDLCHAWLVRDADPVLAPGAIEGFPNVYRRQNCGVGKGSYQPLSTVEPQSVLPKEYFPEPQGHSTDGSKAIFRVDDKLTEDAASGKYQLYEASGGTLKLACVLPNGTPFAGHCSAGSPGFFTNRTASVSNAMSDDGSRVYWSASVPGPRGPNELGRIYLRLNGDTTLPVSETVPSTAPAQFWRASADGDSALFTLTSGPKAGTLYEYELAEEASTPIAGKVLGVAGASEDLSHVYFVSEEALGGEGEAGEPNLYLRAGEATPVFIATLSAQDVVVETSQAPAIPSDVAPEPIYHVARATPDGDHLAFISTESLTGYDNTDQASGEPDSEVFLYSAGSGQVDCVSCNPSGARPSGRRVQAYGNSGFLWTAATIPAAQTQLFHPRALSNDGSRLFFTAYDALLPTDTNGKADVYEWERLGSGSCEEASAAFSPANGGCVYLISSGENPADSEFLDSSPDGNDAFFTTEASLLPQDSGLIDVYDARVGGGFPPPPEPPVACEGEACQRPPAPPTDPTPASAAFRGAGNQSAGPNRPRCPKGKRRVRRAGKPRCAPKRRGKGKQTRQKPHHRANRDKGSQG